MLREGAERTGKGRDVTKNKGGTHSPWKMRLGAKMKTTR